MKKYIFNRFFTKNTLILSVIALLSTACGNNNTNTKATEQQQQAAVQANQNEIRASEESNQKKVKMLEPARFFYSWYSIFQKKYPNTYFVKKENGHFSIDPTKFSEYWIAFKEGGWASDAMINSEKNFYADCAARWAKEAAGSVPSGLEKDRYYGASKFDVNEYLFSGVVMQPEKDDKGTLELSLKNGLKRTMKVHYEGGKWLVDGIE